MKIIFIGTAKFAAIILEKLASTINKPFLVISSPDKPVGRKQSLTSPEVILVAQKYKIPTVQPKKISQFREDLKKLSPDLIIVAAYGQIIPEDILNLPRLGSFNIHPSLLPLWRGPSPIQSTILQGDKKTGVTIMKMTQELDTGPILSQEEIELTGQETFSQLRDSLANLSYELLVKTLTNLSSKRFSLTPQETQVTYSQKLEKKDGKINWQKSAEEIERQIRAFSSWPGSHTYFNNKKEIKKIEIIKAKVHYSIKENSSLPGKVLISSQGKVIVQTGKDFLLIEELQMEGKKKTTIAEFLRGYPHFINTILK